MAVGDKDKIRLHTVEFESEDSAGEEDRLLLLLLLSLSLLLLPLPPLLLLLLLPTNAHAHTSSLPPPHPTFTPSLCMLHARLCPPPLPPPPPPGAMCLGAGDEDSCIVLPEWCIRAGPRKVIYSDPATVSAAIVTCGGLCPGLNDVVQNLVYTLQRYGVPEANILGIRYGLRGFYERDAKPVTLTRAKVDGIHLRGGTMLGTSRGGANIK